MKISFYLILGILILCLPVVIFFSEEGDPRKEIQRPRELRETKAREYVYRGHRYIYFYFSRTTVHDPDCPCKK